MEYDIVDLHQLFESLNQVASCKICRHNLGFERQPVVGLAVRVRLFCANCESNSCTYVNSLLVKDTVDNNQTYYDLNLRLVQGLRSIGKGQTAGKILLACLILPPPPAKYKKYEDRLLRAMEELSCESMKKAAKEAIDINGGPDLCVAVDGSWQKRGHVSLNGVLSVTSVDTGKVLDVSVLSKFCKCVRRHDQIHENTCQANYQGTSGGMELEGALNVFRRSEHLNGARYLRFLGDGDSKAFAAVNNEKVYGDGVEIEKLECIGHVQKRMGNRLMKLKASKKVMAKL